MTKAGTGPVKRFFALLICLLLLSALTANAASNADKQDLTVNHADNLSRLFRTSPDYCLYCSGCHTGTWGTFVQFFHNVGYFFCGSKSCGLTTKNCSESPPAPLIQKLSLGRKSTSASKASLKCVT